MGVGRSVPKARAELEACAGLRLLKAKDWDDALEVCAQAMNGTEHCEGDPMLNFVLGPKMSNYKDPRRLEVLRFLAALILEEDWRWSRHSLPLAMEALDGTLGAVCLARRSNGGASCPSCLPCVPWFCCRKWSRRFPGAAHVMGEAASRMMGPDGLEMQLHERRLIYAAEPHFSIPLMMVNPIFQGRGLCSKAMRAVCHAADREGLPCFLETGGLRNVAIYRRFGFEVLDQFMLSDNSTEIFILRRPCFKRIAWSEV